VQLQYQKLLQRLFCACVLAWIPHEVFAQQGASSLPALWADQRAVVELQMAQSPASSLAAPAGESAPPSAQAEARPYGEQPNYVLPIYEVIGFNLLLNLYDRHVYGDEYKSTLASIRRNLHSSWVVDDDPFSINQLYHPYQGATYFGFARSTGVDYWKSLAYSIGGSAMWEIAGETTPPSRNDLINTGIGGSFLGEVLFRLANLFLENESVPPFWREVGAAAISPSTGFNRIAFGERYKSVFDSHGPVNYSRLSVGFSGTAQNESGASTTHLKRNEALVDYAIDYGLPGKPGYTYDRPFDYFTMQATASSANGFENLMTRGLLVGRDYGVGDAYRGIWGLYGSYDYIAPQTFRVASTGFSLGTTGQWWIARDLALQGTLLGGAGYAAVGTVDSTVDADYNYGLAPQALANLRLIVGERVSIDVTGREWFVSRVAAARRGGHDNIARLDASVTFRVYREHGVMVKYLGNWRNASYPDSGDLSQSRGTVGVFYVLLGHDKFGAVEWSSGTQRTPNASPGSELWK